MRKRKLLLLFFLLVTGIHLSLAQKSNNLKKSIESGKTVYTQYCLSCHQSDGLGVQNMNPPLAGTSFVKGDKNKLIGIVLNGLSNTEIDGEIYRNIMPPFDYLSDEQIADVLTYVRNNFGNKSKQVMTEEVTAVRENNKKP